VTRRHLLGTIGLFAVVTPVLAACGGGAAPAAAPTAAPASGNSQSAPAAQPTATAAPAAQAAPAGGKTSMTIAVYADATRPWMKNWPTKWSQANPDVSLRIDEIAYGDMNTKQIAELAAGTLQDVNFSGNKWLRYTAYKQGFYAMDDLMKAKPLDKEDFVPSALVGGQFEGKQYGVPFEWNPGNINVIQYNKDMLQAKGVKEPTDTMSHDDYTQLASQMTDASKGIYGTDLWVNTYYDFGDTVRDLGGDVMSDDGKKFLIGTDPLCKQVAQYFVDFRAKYKSAPDRAGMQQEQLFPTGKIATTATGAVSVKANAKSVGDKFKWGAVLGPVGPQGLRGYDSFSAHWNIYGKTKVPDKAYDLVLFISSKDSATDALRSDGQVPARLSVWRDPAANKDSDIFKRVADWISDGKSKGPFPIPDNLRYTELETTFENVGFPMFYAEAPLEETLQKIQTECQKIMDEPRG
jgi:ABC-type glycerol-3-phosphate transport system substrate-binding protein